MKINSHFSWVALFSIFLIFSMACNLSIPSDTSNEPLEPDTIQPEQPTLALDPNDDIDIVESTPVPTSVPEIVESPTRKIQVFDFNSSNEDGTCGTEGNVNEAGEEYDCAVVFSNGFPIQLEIFKNGQEIGREDGVQNVFFSVTQTDNDDNTSTIYEQTENDAPYCIFGGDGPCNPWVLEDDVYKWEPGGLPLQTGVYHVDIVTNLDDLSVVLVWNADISVTLP